MNGLAASGIEDAEAERGSSPGGQGRKRERDLTEMMILSRRGAVRGTNRRSPEPPRTVMTLDRAAVRAQEGLSGKGCNGVWLDTPSVSAWR